ncbi:hypothetical protein [Streptomyces sp. AF1A]|jgi:hypothetical protein|uniref:DUF7144 family membrane protein n=1 Tax=Streptomyces sp. AF1A TaxID=3394350 RepID=UPI0039BC7FE0
MTTTHAPHTPTAREEWATGLAAFAAVMLLLAGILAICRGIMAIAHDDVFFVTRDYVFRFSLTGWGWVHLILGVVAVLVAFGLFRAAMWARASGVAIASLIIIANFLSLPYYPVWSIVVIALSAFIIWALCVVRKDGTAGLFG